MRLTVNGTTWEGTLDPRTTLLDALRLHLGLTGTRKGCDHGQCGACTVRVDGVRVNACLALAIMHDGHDIQTVEGLGDEDARHPLQDAFVEKDAFQCGYCTSGQLNSARALLDELDAGLPSVVTPPGADPEPTDAEIRERMSGNLCRCGAYANLVSAIGSVARSEP